MKPGGMRRGGRRVAAAASDPDPRRAEPGAADVCPSGSTRPGAPGDAPEDSSPNDDARPIHHRRAAGAQRARGRRLVKRRRCAVNVFDALGQTLHDQDRLSDLWQGLATTRPVLLGRANREDRGRCRLPIHHTQLWRRPARGPRALQSGKKIVVAVSVLKKKPPRFDVGQQALCLIPRATMCDVYMYQLHVSLFK
jgi:hypothetical protein